MRLRPGVHLANASDVGRERERNEDYFAYVEPDDDELFAQKGRLAMVADGMGGAEGGYQASRTAVEVIRESYFHDAVTEPLEALRHAVQRANEELRRSARDGGGPRGMGTTVTAVVLLSGKVFFAHVGDSRAYLVRDGEIDQLTRDHTRVGRMVEEGLISPREAAERTDGHVLSRAVGTADTLEIDVQQCPFTTRPGDRLLLCSDGLHGQLSDEALLHACRTLDPQDACDELVRMANERGGPDNITVQILLVDEEPRTPAAGDREDAESAAGDGEDPAPDAEEVLESGSRRGHGWGKFALGFVAGLLLGFLLFGGHRLPQGGAAPPVPRAGATAAQKNGQPLTGRSNRPARDAGAQENRGPHPPAPRSPPPAIDRRTFRPAD